MTEQNNDKGISIPTPSVPHIEAMRSMTPFSPENQELTWEKGPYWNRERGDVLPHHQAILRAYAAFLEREVLGQITPEDFSNSDILMRWVTGISPRPEDVVALDPIRGPAMKTIFEYRLEKSAQTAGEDAVKQTLASYRTLVRAMVESRWMILPDAQVMDERLGYLRECNNTEKLTLLENRIRKNARELLEG